MAEDTFKSIPGYEGLYEVSSDGRVKSVERTKVCGGRVLRVHERLLSIHLSTRGYRMAHLCKDGTRRMTEVHRLVALAWLGMPVGARTTVNHISGDKLDNSVGNLEWLTVKENIAHAHATGLTSSVGASNPKAKLTDEVVRLMRQKAADGASAGDLVAEFGIGRGAVYRAVNRVTWRHVE